MKLDILLRTAAKILIPFILLFAMYVQFHGDFGPGGGFQAGVMAGAMVVLYAIIFGLDAAQRAAPARLAGLMVPIGAGIYGVVGVASFFFGAHYLDYSVLAHDAPHGQHIGVLLVEIGVLVTVAGTMVAIFYAFLERGRK